MTEMVLENKEALPFQARKMSIREVMKNEKGLTLIELLAVIVIIAIIAAIAIPSIGSILEKTRLNAHRSNAHMVIDAARLYVSNENVTLSGNTTLDLSLADLNAKGYLELIPKDPSNKPNNYAPGTAVSATNTTADTSKSYVHIKKDASGNFQYFVTLMGAQTTGVKYLDSSLESNIEDPDHVKEDGTATADPTT